MGPFVPPREKADWEYDTEPVSARVMEIVHDLENHVTPFDTRNRLHGGIWVRASYGHRVQCSDPHGGPCNWRSSVVPSRDDLTNPALREWNIHRAEMGLRDGVFS